MNLLITFFSVSSALYAQKHFVKRGKRCTLIPVPRSVSSSCGYALVAEEMPLEMVKAAFSDANIEWERIHEPVSNGGNESYRPVTSWNDEDASNDWQE